MNIFQIIPSVVFVEDEFDKNFVNKLKQQGIIDNNNIKINGYKGTSKQYIVKPLDTIKTVAQKLNMSEDELLNKVGHSRLYVGQIIEL